MSRLPKVSLPVVVGAAMALIVLIGAGAFVARRAANAADPLKGNQVSATDLRILVRAGSSCPTVTPARLAGQVMVASNFGSQPVPEMREGGATGIAALTPEQWQKYAPWPGANPSDREAGITALAHAMCQLTGQARAMKITEDPWQVALAAHRLGMEQVIAAGDIPDDARDYVDTVQRYASWYALQPAFGGGPAALTPPSGSAAGGNAVVPVPNLYVNAVVAAGKVCREIPPTLIAAQIMATSGFDPNRLGPAGEQGIAQFLPRVWTANVKSASNQTPWEPSAAIPALGRTMCKLVKESGGQYGPALAGFTRGDRNAATPLVEVVTKSQAEYAKDTRLQAAKAPTSATPSSTPGKPGKPKSTTQKRNNQPPVKTADGDGSGRSRGPYFILNLRTGECADLPGEGGGLRDGPVDQYPCFKTGDDNQDWTFVPRGTDGAGYQLYWIRNIDDNFCIDPTGLGRVASGTPLHETVCFDQDNQYFRLEPKVTSGGFQYYWLRNTVTDMCLEVSGPGNGGPEAPLLLLHCVSGDDHEWALVEKSEW